MTVLAPASPAGPPWAPPRRRRMSSADARQLDYDPACGLPLEAWLANRRAEGWEPVPGARAVVRLQGGARLAVRVRRVWRT